jgi:hypothetical protein
MTRMIANIAALTAVIVVAVGCTSAARPSAASGPATSSPSSSPASTASTAPSASIEAVTPIPDALRYVWLGPARVIAALGGPQALSIIRIRGEKFDYIYGGQGEEALNSAVSVTAPGQIRLTSANATAGCRVGDQGTYEWTTTTAGAGLTLRTVDEPCGPRAEAVVGDWVRAACRDFGCLGDLDAGTHQTAFFEPLGNPTAFSASWRMQYGGLSYTVPAGWANAVDDPNVYDIVPQADYAKVVPDMALYSGISLLPDIGVAAQDDACSPSVEPGVGRGSGEIAARIARIPSLEVGASAPMTVAGWSGTMLDVAVKPDWQRFCPVRGGVPVLTGDRRLSAAERWRLILLDVATGHTMAIIISDSSEPSRFDDLVARAMPIVASFEYHPPTP